MGRSRDLSEVATAFDAGSLGYRNKIINGAMQIDQRNAGASVSGNGDFPVDRFRAFQNTSATYTAQRSTTAPSNYSNSLLFTVGSAASATAAQYAGIETRLEGFNVADIGFGTSACKPVALSFVVRSSVTGTYCVSLTNSANNRVYVAEYTITSADTFETKSITVPAITSGTWLTDNGIGVKVWFDLGSGTDRNTTASAWQTNGPYTRTTNQTNFINNAGATFYITGVQLEVGETATPFEHRPFGTEFALCQRYYETSKGYSGGDNRVRWNGSTDQSSNFTCQTRYAVQKRTTPTQYYFKTDGTSAGSVAVAGSGVSGDRTANVWNQSGAQFSFYVSFGSAYNWGSGFVEGQWIADAEL